MKKSPCKDCDFISNAAAVLNESELNTLENNCAQVQFKKGDIIFKQDALSSNIIYLKTGLVKLHIAVARKEHIIKISEAPSFLGLPTTFAEKTNQYSTTALSDVVACFIDIDAFKHFIFKNGAFAYEIIVNLCRNNLEYFRRCMDNKQKQLPGRVAENILYFSRVIFESNEFELPISRVEFGELICTSRESISHILSEFHHDHLIELHGKKIKILNEKLLEQVSKNG